MTPGTTKVAGGQPVWTRDTIHKALRRYHELYGELTAACFNPSGGKWADRPELVERYYAGDPETGLAWPSLNTVKSFHDGSFNAARVAIGLEPNRPGPNRRAAGKHAPIRDVRERVRMRVVERAADPRWGARLAGEPRVERVEVPAPGDARLRKRVTTVERRMAKTVESLRAARKALAVARAARKTAEREAAAIAGRLRAAEAERATVAATVAAANRAEAEAASTSTLVSRELADTRMLVAERDAALVEATARVEELQATVELMDPAQLEAARVEVEGARARVAAASAAQREAESRTVAAGVERRAAETRAVKAERAAARADGERRRVQEAVAGHARPLTPGEVEELRERGPQGPAVFMAAVKGVVQAQAKGERAKLRDALRRVAAAAVSWADRL